MSEARGLRHLHALAKAFISRYAMRMSHTGKSHHALIRDPVISVATLVSTTF
jgi:hypothetical protein